MIIITITNWPKIVIITITHNLTDFLSSCLDFDKLNKVLKKNKVFKILGGSWHHSVHKIDLTKNPLNRCRNWWHSMELAIGNWLQNISYSYPLHCVPTVQLQLRSQLLQKCNQLQLIYNYKLPIQVGSLITLHEAESQCSEITSFCCYDRLYRDMVTITLCNIDPEDSMQRRHYLLIIQEEMSQ